MNKDTMDMLDREIAVEAAKSGNGPEEYGLDPWDRIIPLAGHDLPRMPKGILPAWAGDFAEALSDSTETPYELAFGMVLSALSVAAARRWRVSILPDYDETLNLWQVVALPSGTRKSAVQRATMQPLVAWERNAAEIMDKTIKQLTSSRRTKEARIRALRERAARAKDDFEANAIEIEAMHLEATLTEIPAFPRIWTSDATPERLASLMADNYEAIGWMSSEGGIFDILRGRYSSGALNLDVVLKAYSGDPERIDRKGAPPVMLDLPRLTIGLCPQPDVLRGLAGAPGFRGRGLLARFLYLLPQSPLGKRRFLAHGMDKAEVNAYAVGLEAMLGHHEDCSTETESISLSKDAFDIWHEYGRRIEERLGPDGDLGQSQDWGGKATGTCARIAGVIHCAANAFEIAEDIPMPGETMLAAVDAMGVYAGHSLQALSQMGYCGPISGALVILDWISRGRRRTFSLADCFAALQANFARKSSLMESIEILEERHYCQVLASNPRESATHTVVVVNPACHADGTGDTQ